MESEQEFQDFIYSEVEKLKIDKWIEGEKRCTDPGVEYEMFWVSTNAKNYRNAWVMSKCRTCCLKRKCGYNTLSACMDYYPAN